MSVLLIDGDNYEAKKSLLEDILIGYKEKFDASLDKEPLEQANVQLDIDCRIMDSGLMGRFYQGSPSNTFESLF